MKKMQTVHFGTGNPTQVNVAPFKAATKASAPKNAAMKEVSDAWPDNANS